MSAPQPAVLVPAAFVHFGDLLRFLRRRAQLTQRDLGIAVGYNFAQICRLEQGQRLPARGTVESVFIAALGLEESPEWAARLIELADTARQQRDEAALAETLGRPPAAADPEPLEAIPDPAPGEVPRLTLVARLHARLVAERRVALCGLAGIGKTTLAAALAREYAETTPVFWLTFTAGVTTSVEVLLRRLARFLQARGQPEVAPLLRAAGQADLALPLDQQIGLLSAAIAHLAAGRTSRRVSPPLLCFDNVHLVQDDQAIVRVLRHLSATTNATLLLTSRENLQVLPGCPQVRLSGLELDEGLALIANLTGPAAGIVAPAWAASLLEKTGGSPMLLRLAVAELVEAQVAPAAFIAQLASQPQIASYLLETVRRHISPAAWGVLALIAVFRQPIDLHDPALIELIQQTDGAENLPAALSELIQRHLIDHPARARLHPLVRDYAYSALLTLPIYRRQLHRIAAEWSEQGMDDAVEASYHYCHAGDLIDAVATLEDHAEAIGQRGQAFAAADMAEVALAQVRRLRSAGRAADHAGELARRLLVLCGDLLVHTARAQAAEASYREALALSNSADDRARIVYRLALSLTQRGQAGEAVLRCRDAAAALAADEMMLRARLSAAESQAHMTLTDYAAASAAAGQALALADRIDGAAQRDAAEVRARAHRVLGTIARYRQDLDAALAHLRIAIQSARQTDLPELLWGYELEEARLLYVRGELAALLARCDDLLPRLHASGDSYAMSQLYSLLALSKITCGELAAGLAAAEQAYAIRQEIGDTHGLTPAANLRALALIYLGRLAEARVLIEHVLATYEATGDRHDLGYTLDKLAMIQMLEGDSTAAQATLREALELPAIAADAKLRDDIGHDLAIALIMGGAVEQARQLLAGLPPHNERQIDLDRQLIGGLIALASGDRSAAQAAANAVADQARQLGYLLHVLKAGQLAKAALSPPSLARFPHLLWVIEPR